MKDNTQEKFILEKSFYGLSKNDVIKLLHDYVKVELDQEWYYLIETTIFKNNIILYLIFNEDKVEEKHIIKNHEKSLLSKLFENIQRSDRS